MKYQIIKVTDTNGHCHYEGKYTRKNWLGKEVWDRAFCYSFDFTSKEYDFPSEEKVMQAIRANMPNFIQRKIIKEGEL